ncbi:hypothetical protein C2S52_012067 [Perilla frutescens var. hirtella]|nr:hypothetical protein C2S52_012067 [Perilla frutescens var. hirtella]
MAKIPKLMFITEVAPSKFISKSKRWPRGVEVLDTIFEDKAYASTLLPSSFEEWLQPETDHRGIFPSA